MKIRHLSLISLLSLLLFISSCKKDEEISVSHEVTQLPSDVTQLFKEKGNLSSNKVILYSNGGPDKELDTGYFDDLQLSNYHEVYVHQSNTLNPDVIGAKLNLTVEQAIRENAVSVEILQKVAEHFKSEGKEVYIVGHSFGAILIPALIAKHKNIAKRYLIMAGRLDFPDKLWQEFNERRGYYFKDGVTLTSQNFSQGVSETEKNETYARMRLQAGFGKNRYTTLLKDKDLSNVIYAYGQKDEPVGRLTKNEVDFLTSKNATVIEIPNGGHGSMIDLPYRTNLTSELLK
ncbi:alpha/beta hydrolase [Flammeovirga pectinis]|uniref:Alpha/beta hydrolase n=1 Tax=Flammeovirga pectinis TaxID=2494373 RepID=A0A3Q9FPN7_9BACT|nr:alpha/beta fold hydrolase [Flammeovirga pectinis]AZQ62465.1 alpha/beta hydrolase [Flammeovirga pectinis]